MLQTLQPRSPVLKYFRNLPEEGLLSVFAESVRCTDRHTLALRHANAACVYVCMAGFGPGCGELDAIESLSSSSSTDVDVVYYYDATRGGQLRANASCRQHGHVLVPSPASDRIWPARSSISVYCVGFVWSEVVPTRCVGQSSQC